MKTDTELLDNVAYKITQILRIPVGEIDKIKFVYLYGLLYNLMGQGPDGDENMRHWLNTFNSHLNFCPAARLADEASFDKIIRYLESFNR